MQTHQRQNFLQLSYDSHKGLQLFWNFKDLFAYQRYFRHIFVITTDKTSQIIKILQILYKRMKSGDLFCCIYPHDAQISKIGKWIQKSLISSFKPSSYFKQISKRSLDKLTKTKLIDAAGREALEFDEPVVINFLGVEEKETDFYKEEILRHRSSLTPTYAYIANLFGDFTSNDISVHTGINMFNTNVPDFHDHAEYYHKLINGAAVQSAYIQIIAMNGQFTLFNECYWRNPDFNRISATYYGPSSRFNYQKLAFYNIDPNAYVQHEFEVKLRIKLFQNRILESVKRIKINFLLNRDYCPTFQNTRTQNSYHHQKNIFLHENPNTCELMVKYQARRQDMQI